MQPRILLAGIAKDEAAYLPEWIYYHLNIGIKSVLVYVNNTSDNSIAVLDKIKKNNPVDYKVVDGIEKRNDAVFDNLISNRYLSYSPLQSKSYADIYINTDPNDFDYILYLDIDEFICLDKSLEQLHDEGELKSSVINFRWFSATGDTIPFSPLSENIKGEYDQFCKFMIKTGVEGTVFKSCHTASVNSQDETVYDKGLVIHRVLRSKVEYLALLARSNPTKKKLTNGFKLNRRGWTDKAGNELPKMYSYLFKNYLSDLKVFYSKNNLDEEIDFAQKNVRERAEIVQNELNLLVKTNLELGRVLDGTGVRHFSFSGWLKNEIKNKLITIFFPSLRIKHIPVSNYIKYKLGLIKKDKFMD